MALTYRTTDATKWGTGKGSPLTMVEGDTNIWELATRLLNLEQNPPQANEISNIVVINNSQFKIIMEDGTEFGPYPLPIAVFKFQGDWQNSYTYFPNDTIEVPNVGMYLVLKQHATPAPPAPFDPNFTVGGEPAYQQMFGYPDVTAVAAVSNTYPAIEHMAFGGI